MFDEEIVQYQESPEEIVQEAPQHSTSQDNRDKEALKAENFRQMRQQMEQAQRERDEAVRSLKASQDNQSDEDVTLGPDELAEGKHLTKVQKKIRNLEDQLRNYKQETSQQVTEARLKSQYSDFESVVNMNNIERLKMEYPEIFSTLNASTDLYNKAVSAYTLIKKFGINQTMETIEADKERIRANANKPRPVASVSPQQGDSALSRANAFANGLTEELKQQLRKEMYDSRRNH